MIRTLLRPKLLSFKNRWRKESLAKRRSQDVILILVSVGLMIGMYYGTRWGLRQIDSVPSLANLPPRLTLGLLLTMLLGMVTISSLATTLANFYLADDVELILSCPVPPYRFFLARFLYVTFLVSWMPFVFIFPVLLAFGRAYGADIWFYVTGVFALLPYFAIPAAVATILAAFIMSVIDPRWTKILLGLALGFGICGIVYAAQMVAELATSRANPDQLLRFITTFSAASSPYMPSSWLAIALSEILAPEGKGSALRILLSYSTAICVISLAYLAIELLHGRGYTRARNSARSDRRRGTSRAPALPRFRTPAVAIVRKEFRSVFRDLAQSTQIVFLGAICLLYLTNLKMFVAIDAFPPETRFWWQQIFFMIHASITAFFTSSICTRMVFSSVSLEGKQFWLLQTAPLEMRDVLRSKLSAWFPPVALISAVLFTAGAYIIVGRFDVLAFYLVISLFVSYGIVGLGIGLGAYFADFSWDHPSQLALSIGSFVYMLATAVLVIANIIPLGIMLRYGAANTEAALLHNIGMTVLIGGIIALVNVTLAKLAMRLGERALLAGATQ